MNSSFKSAMLTAAKMTAAGDLQAATAAIQRALAGRQPQAANAGAREPREPREPRDASAASDVIDIESRWIGDGAVDSEAAGTGNTEQPKKAVWTGRGGDAWKKVGAWMRAGEGMPGGRVASGGGSGASGDSGGDYGEAMLSGSFGNAAGRRDYLLHRPADSADAGVRRPLVIMLHGCTQNPADFAAGTAMNVLADRHGFLVLYPGQCRNANPSACWNWFDPDSQRPMSGEPSIIAGMVNDVADSHNVDRDRIFVAGLSAGGAMAAILAQTSPDLIAAVAVHSGLPAGAAHDLPSALSAMKRGAGAAAAPGPRQPGPRRPMRTIVFHGRQDRTVHPANGGQVAAAALAGWPPGALSVRQEQGRAPGGRSYTRTRHVDADGRAMVERWEVQGAGHAWSGGHPSGTHTDPAGPDASAAMIDFFLSM